MQNDFGKGFEELASVGKYSLKVAVDVTANAVKLAGELTKTVGKKVIKDVEKSVEGIGNLLHKNNKKDMNENKKN
jgi:hypothetical protein